MILLCFSLIMFPTKKEEIESFLIVFGPLFSFPALGNNSSFFNAFFFGGKKKKKKRRRRRRKNQGENYSFEIDSAGDVYYGGP